MPPTLAVILILGLGLSQRTSSQKQMLSKPAIWVKPSFMIPNGTPAAIGCRGAGEAEEYHLYFERGPSALERPTSPLVMNWVKFPIPAMTLHTAGRYRCSYRSGAFWSELSDPLELVVTGLYDTPTLSVEPGSEVTSGENVIFRCQLATATSRFFLLKAGRSSRPQLRYGNLWAEFHLGPVTPAHRGTYRCFGSYNNHVWSFPSKPVKLLVKGDAGNTTFAPTEHTSSDHWDYELTTGTQSQKDHFLWNHMAQNLIRLGLAVLVLAALVGLLLEDWLHRSKPRETDHRASRRGHRRRLRAQRALETRPRDAAATGGAESSPDMGLWELHVEPKEEGGRCRELREDCMQLGQREMKTARFPADQAHCLFQV